MTQERVSKTITDRLVRLLLSHEVPEDVKNGYEQYEQEVKNSYSRAYYWHGSGRYQYRDGQVIDTLKSILDNQGISPHTDVWDVTKGRIDTISLAMSRMYARIYAQMHLYEGEELQYQFGSRALWSAKFIGETTLQGMFFGEVQKSSFKKINGLYSRFIKNKRDWVAKLRSDAHTNPQHVIKTFTSIHSDIKGNYPVLFGIQQSDVAPIDTASYIQRYECRTDKEIPIVGLTHVEVPLSNVQATAELLQEYGLESLPVIPMEYGEIYCSQFNYSRLIKEGLLV